WISRKWILYRNFPYFLKRGIGWQCNNIDSWCFQNIFDIQIIKIKDSLIRLDSASLNVPSESAMSTILRNSSFETDTSSAEFPFESQFVIRSVNQLSTFVTGFRTKTKNRIIGETTIEIRFGKAAATDFG